MFDLDPNLICGSVKGEIHLVRNSCLFPYKTEDNQALTADKYCLSKTYPAHISFVNQCETTSSNLKYLFTSGITDECVMKWILIQE